MEPSARDVLIDKVLRGELTPEEAEAEAAEIGIGPLSRVPDPVRFNPLIKAWWTLPMAIAWIAWRTSAKVREFWDEYRAECWCWIPYTLGEDILSVRIDGYRLEKMAPATKALLASHSRRPPPHRYEPTVTDEAEASLWRALGDNLLQAVGTEIGTGRRSEIWYPEWSDLEWRMDWGEEAFTILRKGTVDQGYENVRIRCADLVALWQPAKASVVTLPETVSPIGPGHVTLFHAAQWIATNGGSVSANTTTDPLIWKRAYDQLLARAASDEILVTGLKGGQREKVASDTFAGIAVDYPFGESIDIALSEEVYLLCYPYIDDAYWRNGFDDSLRGRTGVVWSRLMVRKADVARWWPFGLHDTDTAASPNRTGAPGRPSSMHLVEAEYKRRCGTGDAKAVLREEAEELSKWLRQAHPHAPSATSGTIANRIRNEHRQRFGSSRN